MSWKLFAASKNTKFVAFYTLSVTLIAFNQILSYYNSTIEIFPIFNTFTGYFLCPLLFFQCVSLFHIKSLKKRVMQHFLVSIPFLCVITYWIFDDYRRKLLGYTHNSYITLLLVGQCVVYILLLAKFLNDRKEFLQRIRPTLQYKRIRFTLLLFLIQVLLTAVILVENFASIYMADQYLVFFIFMLVLVQLALIFFIHTKRPAFFTENDRLVQLSDEGKDKDGPLKEQAANPVLKELQRLMAEEKRFKDAGLTLKRLAEELNVAEHTLSGILKDAYHLTYTQYISSLRLEEAKKLLIQARAGDARINEIMYEVGFNSKSAFNTWFKKNTGLTPSAFKKGSE